MTTDVLAKSVTKADYSTDAGKSAPVFNLFVGGLPWMKEDGGLPPHPPPYWSRERDFVLKATPLFDTQWANAVFIAISKVASWDWSLIGYPPIRVRKIQELLTNVQDGKGWTHFISKHLRDYLLTDNGAFIEIVRASSAAGSRILGLVHLDSSRCRRTGDPDIPVLFRDKKGREHELKAHQVLTLSDMPDSTDTLYDVGFCAASRAYRAIYKLSSMETYVSEKITGRRPQRLYVVSNITRTQLDTAVTSNELEKQDQGFIAYRGAVIIPAIDPTGETKIASIDLAGLPENFEAEKERRACLLSYANALGLDPQELDPDLLASKGMGTGSQSRVIDDKASGRGIIAWRAMFTHLINQEVIPDRVQFIFTEQDVRDRKLKSDADSVDVSNAVQLVVNKIITPLMGLQMLCDKKVVPPEFLPQDMTPTTTLTQDDKLTPDELQADASLIGQELQRLQQSQDIEFENQLLGLEGQRAALQPSTGLPPGNAPQPEKEES